MIKISKTLTLREILPQDHKDLFRLMSRIYPPVYSHLWDDSGKWYIHHLYSLDNFKKELSEPNSCYFFIQESDHPIGILRLLEDQPCIDNPHKKAVKLQRIYLDPVVLGQGIGKMVMQWIEDWDRLQSYELIWLEVMDSQKLALAFYEKLGFTVSGNFRLEYEQMHEHLRGMFRMTKSLITIPK